MKVEMRTESGSGAAGRLRRAGGVPAAINRIDGRTELLKLDAHEFNMMTRKTRGEQTLVMLELDGSEVLALIREVQSDVIDGAPVHIDFGEVSMTSKIRVQIPIQLLGEPASVKVGDGILHQELRMVDVECLPRDIVEHFEVDTTALEANQSLLVSDLGLDTEKFVLLTDTDQIVASVIMAAREEPEEDEEDAEETDAAPEVIAKGKQEKDASAGKASDDK